MNNYKDIINRITILITESGYAPVISYQNALSGYEIVKYFIERAEKYKLGLCPEGTPLLSHAIPRIVFDGIAFQQYLEWDMNSERNYYYFRYNYAQILDLLYLFMMGENQELGDIDIMIVSTLFHKIDKIVTEEISNDFYLENNNGYLEDENIKTLFAKLHILGRSIFLCWKSQNRPRFRMANKLIDEQFNPFFSGRMFTKNNYNDDYYSRYGGYNGYDDDTIDDAFEGDPSLTWNID